MDMKIASHMMAGGIAMAGMFLFASAVESAHLSARPSSALLLAAATEPAPGVPFPDGELRKKESARAPAKATPAESRTPEEAEARAADPKDASGALIIAPPMGAGSSAKSR